MVTIQPLLERSVLRLFVGCVAVLFLVGCGGGSSSGSDEVPGAPSETTNTPPQVNAGPDLSSTSGATVSLIGEGLDAEGDVSLLWSQTSGPDVVLSDLRVTSPSFIAPVVTAETSLTFTLTVTDADGIQAVDSVTVTILADVEPTTPSASSTSLFVNPNKIVIDLARNRAIVSDQETATFIAIDLSSLERTILSDGVTPNAADPIDRPIAMVLDSDRDRLIVADNFRGSRSIRTINLETGERGVLVAQDEPPFDDETFNTIALDPNNNRLLVSTTRPDAIRTVDLDTGAIGLLADDQVPSSVNPLPGISEMVVDSGNNRVLIGDSRAIFAVDLTTGANQRFSDNAFPNGDNSLTRVESMALDLSNNQLVVGDEDRILLVDLDTGNRTLLSGEDTPNAVNRIGRADGMVLDQAGDQVFIIDSRTNSLFVVDLDTGVRNILTQTAIPNLANQFDPFFSGVDLDLANQRLLVAQDDAVLSVDINTGERSLAFAVAGVELIEADSANDRVLVFGARLNFPAGNNLVGIDNTTGATTLLSAAPDEADLVVTTNIVIDTSSNRLFGINGSRNGIVAIDLESGVRQVLSSDTVPSLEDRFGQIEDLVLDAANNRLLVLDASLETVGAVDLISGELTTLADPREFTVVESMALDAANNRVLVTDVLTGSVFAVDLSNGDILEIVERFVPNRVLGVARPVEIEVDPTSNRALVFDQEVGGVLAVDLVTNEVSVFSASTREP